MSVESGSDRPVDPDGPVETTTSAEPAKDRGAAERAGSSGEISRVLVVTAHPDDETLTAGALIAALARRCPVTLVTCTRGERGEVIGDDLAHLADDPTELASYRVGELDRALAALGVTSHLFLDEVDGPRLVDSGMRWDDAAHLIRAVPAADAGPDAFSVAPLERSVLALTKVLDDVRPDLVLVDEPEGGYGHPDHRRAHEVTMAAVERAERRPAFVAWPVRPLSAVRSAQLWLQGRPDLPQAGDAGGALTLAEPEAQLPSIVVPDDAVDVQIDVTDRLPALVAAMGAHRSQVQAVHVVDPAEMIGPAAGWFALSNGLLQPILRGAWLRVAPGWGDPAELRSAVGRLLAGRPEPVATGAWYRPTMIGFAIFLGLAAGALGTIFHRVAPPWGILAALLLVVAGGVLARTFVDRAGQLAFGTATVAAVLLLTYASPNGDVLVTGEPIGVVWILGSLVAAVLGPALAPRGWFAEA